jgi:glycosyltransferase involved in cell wall biosynthesis
MRAHISLAYLNDLSSPYDSFFLNRLSKVYDVTCITFDHNPDTFLGTIPVVKVKDLPFKLPRFDGIRVWSSTLYRTCLLKRILNKIKPDLAIGNNALSYGFYTALANFNPFLLFIWGSDVLIWPKKSFFFKSVVEYSLKKADAVLVDSDVQARACTELGASVDKIIKAPWFDVSETRNIKVDNKAKRKIRLNLGIAEDDIIVISTRWHEPIYSVETLILAISELLKQEHKVKFLIMGGGSRTPVLKRLAHRQGISNKIVFTGRVNREKILEYLQVSDVYVSTSLSDGTSASLLEAMACALPAIVTDIPGNEEWIVNGSNGLLFPVKDSKTLAEKIVTVLKNEDFRKSLGMKAYETVVKKADWQRNSKLLESVIFSLRNTK